ncbi:MAG: hypothetical protein AAGF12_17890 [Myxococcota bacterium]
MLRGGSLLGSRVLIASAPGSLFIAGEYTIVVGGAALVTAVDRYVRVVGGTGETYATEGASFDLRLPRAVCAELGVDEDVLVGLRADVSALVGGGKKYGLSSSAASVVSLCRALRPELPSTELVDVASAAHRRFQGGKGSNADVQVAVRGFTQVLTTNAPTLPEKRFSAPADRRVAFPQGLRAVPVFLDQPASTVSFLKAFIAGLEREEPRATLDALHAATLRVIDAFDADQVPKALEALASADDALGALGDALGAPIWVDRHRALKDACGDEFVAKVSGAGGGDISIVFGEVNAPWEALLSRLPSGVTPLDIRLDAPPEAG